MSSDSPPTEPQPAQKRVLTQAEKEEILRRRKREKLLNPDRLNYIIGATKELDRAAATPPPSVVKPDDNRDSGPMSPHSHSYNTTTSTTTTAAATISTLSVESFDDTPKLDEHDNEPAVPSPIWAPRPDLPPVSSRAPFVTHEGSPIVGKRATPRKSTWTDRLRTPLIVVLAMGLSVAYMGPLGAYLPASNLLLMFLCLEIALVVLSGKAFNAEHPVLSFLTAAASRQGQAPNNMLEQAMGALGALVNAMGAVSQVWRDTTVFVFVLVCCCTLLNVPVLDSLLWSM